jgi:hypothetical protein
MFARFDRECKQDWNQRHGGRIVRFAECEAILQLDEAMAGLNRRPTRTSGFYGSWRLS